jgi:hypothetical protein
LQCASPCIGKIEGPGSHIDSVQIQLMRGPVLQLGRFFTGAAQKLFI